MGGSPWRQLHRSLLRASQSGPVRGGARGGPGGLVMGDGLDFVIEKSPWGIFASDDGEDRGKGGRG